MNQRTAKLIRKFGLTMRYDPNKMVNPAQDTSDKDIKRFWNQTPRPKRHLVRKVWEGAIEK